MNVETLETIAELIAFGNAGHKRLYTDADLVRIDQLAALSSPLPAESHNDLEWLKNKNGVLAFWTTLANGSCSENERLRDKNIIFVKNVIVPHILRVTKPSVDAMKAKLETDD